MTDVCAVNIGPRGRRQRQVVGAVALIAAAGGFVAIQALGLSPWWRAALVLPLWFGWLGLFQAAAGT